MVSQNIVCSLRLTRAVPGPVGHRGVDPARDDDGVHEVREELAAFGHRARYDGGGGGGEHELGSADYY